MMVKNGKCVTTLHIRNFISSLYGSFYFYWNWIEFTFLGVPAIRRSFHTLVLSPVIGSFLLHGHGHGHTSSDKMERSEHVERPSLPPPYPGFIRLLQIFFQSSTVQPRKREMHYRFLGHSEHSRESSIMELTDVALCFPNPLRWRLKSGITSPPPNNSYTTYEKRAFLYMKEHYYSTRINNIDFYLVFNYGTI